MSLPSHVPHFSTYLVDFDHLEPMYALRPAGASLRAWDKLEELERRLHAFDWASMVVRNPRQCTTFIGDLAFAFLLGFEATLQVLNNERGRAKFDAWLQTLSSYNLPCRGIRTMRNLDAHVRAGHIQAGIGQGVYTHFTTPGTSQTAVAWRFPPISARELSSLLPHGRKLATTELADWNRHVESQFAIDIMREGLISLVEIVTRASLAVGHSAIAYPNPHQGSVTSALTPIR
jgi:hypothetical protein